MPMHEYGRVRTTLRNLFGQMSLPIILARQSSLFRSRVKDRSLDDVTIRILESIMSSGDAESLIGVGSVLKQFMRDESVHIYTEIAEESFEIKLLCTDFLVRAFAVIGDIESCLALRYEALVMREQKAIANPGLKVTCEEWLTLIEHLFESGFHSIAHQACEKALGSFELNHVFHPKMDDLAHDEHVFNKIKGLKEAALITISSQSVQAQAATYLKHKVEVKPNITTSIEAQSSGSSMFRSGLKRHNSRRLHYYRSVRDSSSQYFPIP